MVMSHGAFMVGSCHFGRVGSYGHGLGVHWPPEPSSDETHCFDLQERERRMEYVPERSEAASNRIYTGASKSR